MEINKDKISKNKERFIWVFVLGIMICFAYYGYYKFDIPIIKTLIHGFAGFGFGTMFVKIFIP